MIIKAIKYFFYMVYTRLKGFKYEHIKRKEGIHKATEYAVKCMYLWSKFTINTIGMNVVVKGKENIPNGPCVFIGNHTSILDIPIMFYTIDRLVGFVAKKEMLKAPVIGTWLEKAHCIPLDRENPREAIKTINYGVELLKKGYSLAIFPEGTRSKDGNIGEFKKGSLKLATKAKAPIVPIAIDRAYTSFEKDKKFKPSKIKVTFGNAISTAELTKEEEKTLNEDVRNIIKSYLS